MGLQLVADYRNLQPLIHGEVVQALSKNRSLFPGCDFMTTVGVIERAWVIDVIEACTLLSIRQETSVPVLRTIQDIDESNLLRGRLFKLITACGYHHIPEGELRLEILSTGLYLFSK